MSKRLIDANELISAMYYYEHNEGGLTAYDAQDIINKAPTIEPKRGKWIQTSNDWIAGTCGAMFYPYHCSSCGYETYDDYDGLYNFCPNCGARMKTADNERDYERAIEQMQHDILYEPTYNPEDGSM